jgi:hypothetical protein
MPGATACLAAPVDNPKRLDAGLDRFRRRAFDEGTST